MNNDAKLASELYNKQFAEFSSKSQQYVVVQEFRNKVYEQVDSFKDKKILFAGCGDGTECIPAVRQGAQVYGIDISEKAIEHSQKNCSTGKFSVMDFEKTTFEDNSFDYIISLFSVMYTAKLDSLLVEFKRLLIPNGFIILAVPHPIRKMIKYNNFNYFIKGKQFESWRGVERFNYYRLFEDYIDDFNKANLKIVKLIEPKPIKENVNTPDSEINYPHFLIFKLYKN